MSLEELQAAIVRLPPEDLDQLSRWFEEFLAGAGAVAASAPRLDREATLHALDDLRRLPPDWNGYGAVPIDRAIIQAAEDMIASLPGDFMTTPKVVPMTRGRLQFEWHRGNRSLELEFESRDRLHYLKWDSDAGLEEEDVIAVTDEGAVHSLLRWFASESVNG